MMLLTLKATYRLRGSLTAMPLAGAERLSRAYLSCLRRGRRGPGGGRSRRAASRLCALRESPEQCERGAERARPMGVTSLRCLIRRSACAARAAGARVTARPAAAALQRARAPRMLRPCEPTVGPGLPAERTGRRAGNAGALLPGRPSHWGSWSIRSLLFSLWDSKASVIALDSYIHILLFLFKLL